MSGCKSRSAEISSNASGARYSLIPLRPTVGPPNGVVSVGWLPRAAQMYPLVHVSLPAVGSESRQYDNTIAPPSRHLSHLVVSCNTTIYAIWAVLQQSLTAIVGRDTLPTRPDTV